MSESNITLIELLDALDDEFGDIEITTDNMYECVIDLGIPLEKRMNALNKYYKLKGIETLEVINRLIALYTISGGVKSIEEYLYNISINRDINIDLRLHIAKELGMSDKFEALNIVLENRPDVPTAVKYEAICVLMRCDKYKTESLTYAKEIITNHSLEDEYRYKCVLSLDFIFDNIKTGYMLDYRYAGKKPDEELTEKNKAVDVKKHEYQAQLAWTFFMDSKNMTYYRILASQLLPDDEEVEKTLLSFSNDTELDYNIRADAADAVLRTSKNEDHRLIATNIILVLGGNAVTVYGNKQNVHNRAIEDSAMEGLEILAKTEPVKALNFESIKFAIERHPLYNKYNVDEKLEIALKRIEVDRALYGKQNLTLQNVLIRLWTYIYNNEYTEAMKERLLEELNSAAGTCSTGIISRMVNVMSGFGDFSIRISWEDQIIGNLAGRLNSAINNLEDEEKKGLIIEEMTIPPRFFEKRLNFLTFFRQNISDIFEDIREEFKNDMSIQDFDLYLRKAVAHYEGEY